MLNSKTFTAAKVPCIAPHFIRQLLRNSLDDYFKLATDISLESAE